MINKSHKIVALSAIFVAMSAIAASAGVVQGMEGDKIDPVPIQPITDFSPQTSTSTYNNMDALLGFRVTSGTGATLDGIIDLGSVTQFNHDCNPAGHCNGAGMSSPSIARNRHFFL